MRNVRSFTVVVGLLMVLASAAGCGDDSAKGTPQTPAGVAKAERLLAQDEEKPKKFDRPPIARVKSDMEGRTFVQILDDADSAASQEILRGVRAAADLLGMKVKAVDSDGSWPKASRLIGRAVAQDADAIAIYGFRDIHFDLPFEATKAAGIPVVMVGSQDQERLTDEQRQRGVSALASFDYRDAGRRAADWIVADSGGDAHTLIVAAPDLQRSNAQAMGMEEQLRALCRGCETTEIESPRPDWSTRLPGRVRSLLESNPDIDYVYAMVDAMVPPIMSELQGSDMDDRVKVTTYNLAERLPEGVRPGESPDGAVIAAPTEWLGWAATDQIVRLLLGQRALYDVKVPNRTFASSRLRDLYGDASQEKLYGTDYYNQYEDSWRRWR